MEEGASARHKNKITLKSTWFNKRETVVNEMIRRLANTKKRENGNKTSQEQQGNTTSHQNPSKPRRKPYKTIPTGPKTEQDSRPVENVIFIPYTPRGELRKRLQTIDDNITKIMGTGRTKYVERAGLALHSQLVNKNPWQALLGGCGRSICYVCKSTAGKGISCRTESVCYQMTCKFCEDEKQRTVYIGETSRSATERIYEHMWLFKMRKEGDPEKNESNSVLWNHSKTSHNYTMLTSNWKLEITSSHKTPLSRQLTEAVRIMREPKSCILNSKNEFGANNLPEIALKFGNKVMSQPQQRKKNVKRKRKEEDGSEETGDKEPQEVVQATDDNNINHPVVEGGLGQSPPSPPSNNTCSNMARTPTEAANTQKSPTENPCLTTVNSVCSPARGEDQHQGREGDGNLLQKDTSTSGKVDEDGEGKLPIDFGEDRMKGAAAQPQPSSAEGSGATPTHAEGNLLMKNNSTSGKVDEDVKGKLPIDFGEDWTKGAAAQPQSSSAEGSGATPTHVNNSAADNIKPSPKPLHKKRRLIGQFNTHKHASKSKEELQAICRSLKISYTGNKPELIKKILEREGEREAAASFFKIRVPGGNSIKREVHSESGPNIPNIPSTPKRRRQIDEDEEEILTPVRKEAKKGIGDLNERGGVGNGSAKSLIMGSEKEKVLKSEELKISQLEEEIKHKEVRRTIGLEFKEIGGDKEALRSETEASQKSSSSSSQGGEDQVKIIRPSSSSTSSS